MTNIKMVNVKCPRCHGIGRLFNGLNCTECNGTGINNLPETHSLVHLYAYDREHSK